MIKHFLLASVLVLAAIGVGRNSASAQTGDIVGHVIAGYQGWLSEPGDGSPVGKLPAGSGNYHGNYETYPDLREFPDSEQFQNPDRWPDFPNGNPAKLFSSDRDFTADLHTRWMKQYGIDAIGIQRFNEVSHDVPQENQKNDVTRRIRHAAEKNGVKFFVEYDTSGSGNGGWGADFAAGIEKDWDMSADAEHISQSPAYARQNGKPVIEFWGAGLKDNAIIKDPVQWLRLIDNFKRKGFYVIAGTPTAWLTGGGDSVPGFEEVYAACDAINPWLVGRVSNNRNSDAYYTDHLVPESSWCKAHHIDYIPCAYVGTSFFNSNRRTKNVIPRRNGDLMWRQFANLRKSGVTTCFVSMFDEYNEATAIAKSAEDIGMVPANTWFLTLDADGESMSSDFYLRLTRDGGRMLRGEAPLVWDKPTPYWDNLFATSFETGQPQPMTHESAKNVRNGTCMPSAEKAQRGTTSLFYSGTAQGGKATWCGYRLFDFSRSPKTVEANSILYYWIYPENDNGRYVAVDLHFTDGTTLTQSACVDQNGAALRASAGHGNNIPLGSWSVVTARIGALKGKKIDGISLLFDRAKATGEYKGYIDDIQIAR